MPVMFPGPGSTTGRSGIRDRSPSCFRSSGCSSSSLWCVGFSGAVGVLVAAARGKAEFHRCSRSGIAGPTSLRRQANPPTDINADQPHTPLAATKRPTARRAILSLGLPGGPDLVDQAVVARLARVEIAPMPRVLRDLLGGPARAPGEAPIELPQQLLLPATVRSELLRGAGKPRRRLSEVEPRVRCCGAVIGNRDYADGWATDLTTAKDAQCRLQRVGRIHQDEDRPERAVGTVQVELDGPVPAAVQRQKRGCCFRCRIVIEPTGDDHDAALEGLLLEPAPVAHVARIPRARPARAIAGAACARTAVWCSALCRPRSPGPLGPHGSASGTASRCTCAIWDP